MTKKQALAKIEELKKYVAGFGRTKQTIPEKTIYWGETAEEELDWEEAKDWCEEQGGRLPTKIELLQAYEEVDGFIASLYWSATEANANTAYNVYFSNCTTYYANKTNAFNVRCVFDK
jgi:hypothetical protein